MKPFDFFRPESLEAATDLLSQHAPGVRLLAGGTDYLVELKHSGEEPGVVVDISAVPELKLIELREDGLCIGAGVTHSEIMCHPLIREHTPSMIHAAHTIGAVQTRNLGTLGGNLVTCVPSMDSGPTLVALDAQVTIIGKEMSRQIPLTEFFVGPRKTILKPDELLAYIMIPENNLGKPTNFYKFGLRKGQALALVNAASSLWIKSGKFKDVRIALGAVAPVVIRCNKAEEALEGAEVSSKNIEKAAKLAVKEAKPIDDFRASREYRVDLINVLTRRTIDAAVIEAQQN